MATTDSQTRAAARDRDLTGLVALVTGGTRGIGAAICHALAADGAVVAAGYSSNQARADELKQAVEADGGTLSLHQGNIGDAEDCARVVKDVIEQHGRLDILVNNAGITVDKSFLKMSPIAAEYGCERNGSFAESKRGSSTAMWQLWQRSTRGSPNPVTMVCSSLGERCSRAARSAGVFAIPSA